MDSSKREGSELFQLFESYKLTVPFWLIKVLQDQLRKDVLGKEARYSIYRAVWSKLKTKGTVFEGRTVYPEKFVACLNNIFPDENEHKNYGEPTVSLEVIANA